MSDYSGDSVSTATRASSVAEHADDSNITNLDEETKKDDTKSLVDKEQQHERDFNLIWRQFSTETTLTTNAIICDIQHGDKDYIDKHGIDKYIMSRKYEVFHERKHFATDETLFRSYDQLSPIAKKNVSQVFYLQLDRRTSLRH
jgi:hypothetical protein